MLHGSGQPKITYIFKRPYNTVAQPFFIKAQPDRHCKRQSTWMPLTCSHNIILMRLPGGLADIKTALALKHMMPYLMEIITPSKPQSDPTGTDRDRAPIQSCKYHKP
jgi:hypothetical protein